MSTRVICKGVVHGSTVVLVQSPNLPNGSEVNVTIEGESMSDLERQERLEKAFGSCKEDAEDLDRFLELNDEQRRRNRPGLEA